MFFSGPKPVIITGGINQRGRENNQIMAEFCMEDSLGGSSHESLPCGISVLCGFLGNLWRKWAGL